MPGLQLARCGEGITHLQLQQVCGLSPALLPGLAASSARLGVESDLWPAQGEERVQQEQRQRTAAAGGSGQQQQRKYSE